MKPRRTRTEKVDTSADSRNKAIEFSVLSKATSLYSDCIQSLKERKRKLRRSFIVESCDGDKKAARARMDICQIKG